MTTRPMRRRLRPWAAVPGLTALRAIVIGLSAMAAGIGITWGAGALVGFSAEVHPAVFGAVSAYVSVAVVIAGIHLLRRTRDGKVDELLQVAGPTFPLMRRLMTEAPGTYVHSLAVANLAEVGAEALGANALLARVGAYYHDIGKLTQPCFFFENQADGENPHDSSRPCDSARIIRAHVEDGVELGREAGLPEEVLEIIAEHHGTSLVSYFYHKALGEDASTYEADFRYTGGRPRSIEAAIVMLADASEAAVRAMADPDPREIEAVIRGVIAERRVDVQLPDTMRDDDLESLVKVFTRGLVSQRHGRCPYPEFNPYKEGLIADQCVKSPGARAARPLRFRAVGRVHPRSRGTAR